MRKSVRDAFFSAILQHAYGATPEQFDVKLLCLFIRHHIHVDGNSHAWAEVSALPIYLLLRGNIEALACFELSLAKLHCVVALEG